VKPNIKVGIKWNKKRKVRRIHRLIVDHLMLV